MFESFDLKKRIYDLYSFDAPYDPEPVGLFDLLSAEQARNPPGTRFARGDLQLDALCVLRGEDFLFPARQGVAPRLRFGKSP